MAGLIKKDFNVKKRATILLSAALLVSTTQLMAEENPAIEPMQEYLEFAAFSGGAITKQQLANFDSKDIQYIDTRKAAQFEGSHIPDAINIDWREILTRKDEVSATKTVVLYCDTGLLSSKAQFALSVIGYENVRVLFGGYSEWKQ